MSKLKQLDIILEIYELCQDLIQDIGQQLLYFRASVYKNETADLIRTQIAALRNLVALIPSDLLKEPFYDYDAELKNMVSSVPGECTFSARIARLLQNIGDALRAFKEKQNDPNQWEQHNKHSFEQNVYKHRKTILAICRPGSRRWNFFQSL